MPTLRPDDEETDEIFIIVHDPAEASDGHDAADPDSGPASPATSG
jgi:hypothetical protein